MKRFPTLCLAAFLFFCFLLFLFAAPFSESPAQAGTSDQASLPKEAKKEPGLIADFEGEGRSLKNALGGESGSWNLNPMDENNSYTDADVVEVPAKDDKPNRALRLSYSVDSEVPAQNGFWTKLMDFDASEFDHFELDVKGDVLKGFSEVFRIEIKKLKPGSRTEKIKGSYEIPVSDQWETVSIPLNRFTGLIDFADPKAWENPAIARKNLDEFVVIFNDRHVTRKKGVIYLDNLKFVKTGDPGPTAVDFPPRKKEKTETKIEGLEFAKFLIGRLRGFPKEIVVKKEFPEDPKEFLYEVARDTWRFFDEIVDKEHGLPLDTIQLGKKEAVDDGTWIGDYTNVTNIGVYLICLVAAHDLGLISEAEAVQRLKKTIAVIESLEYHESGFPYNYYDTTTLERTSYFVSLVDSGWLCLGLYVVKNAFPEALGKQAEQLLDRGDFIFFYDPVERQMFHGYYDHLKVYSDYHYGTFYSEPRATSYMAIARGDVPEEHWFEGLIRTFPEDYAWQEQAPKHRFLKTVRGHKYYGGYYEWKDMKYVPSWGGSAFEALMPTLMLKEKDLASQGGLGTNDQRHAEGQMRYALEELNMPVWGMSPSSVPEGGYSEFGAKPFGSKGYKAGIVTPHASMLALEFLPNEVIANMRKMIELYDIYGEYGFYDAIAVETGLVAKKYLALDQGMILIAISNYLKEGSIRKHFHADPEMKKGERLLIEENLFEPTAPPTEETEPADSVAPEASSNE